MNALRAAWQAFWNAVRTVAQGVWNAIRGAWQTFTNTIRNIFNTFSNGFKRAWEATWNTVRDIARRVWRTIGDIIEKAINAVIGIVNGLIKGFNKPILVSCRRQTDGGQWTGSEEDRIKLLRLGRYRMFRIGQALRLRHMATKALATMGHPSAGEIEPVDPVAQGPRRRQS